MRRNSIIVTALILALTATYFIAVDHGMIYKPFWMRQLKNPKGATHSEIIGIAKGLAQAGILPPDTGFTEYGKSGNQKAIRIQYVDGIPSVISAGIDNQFETDDDIICSYEKE